MDSVGAELDLARNRIGNLVSEPFSPNSFVIVRAKKILKIKLKNQFYLSKSFAPDLRPRSGSP